MKIRVLAPKGYRLFSVEHPAGAVFEHPPGVHLEAALRHNLVEPAPEKAPAAAVPPEPKK